jgi:hypothetical protein
MQKCLSAILLCDCRVACAVSAQSPGKGMYHAVKKNADCGRSVHRMFLGIGLSLLFITSSRSATCIWNGGGADNNWSTGLNWSGGVAPANDGTAAIVLAGTTQLVIQPT